MDVEGQSGMVRSLIWPKQVSASRQQRRVAPCLLQFNRALTPIKKRVYANKRLLHADKPHLAVNCYARSPTPAALQLTA